MGTLGNIVAKVIGTQCGSGMDTIAASSARQMYDGTGSPQWWLVVFSVVDRNAASEVLVGLLHAVAATLPDGALKTQALDIEWPDDAESLQAVRQWVKARRKAGTTESVPFEDAMGNVAQHLLRPSPLGTILPVSQLVAHHEDRDVGKAAVYAYYHDTVDFKTFSGGMS